MRVIIFGNKITVDMRKNYISFLVIGLVLLLSGCVKDQRIDALKLVAEGGRNSESKMIITDEYSDWAAGDEVRINGTTAPALREPGANPPLPAQRRIRIL